MEQPGKYTMWVEYHCPISAGNVEVAPFWSMENGAIKSNVVEIEVFGSFKRLSKISLVTFTRMRVARSNG
jgi:hypothetical protein